MDDLDHSMHIAEFDWTSFYDESEECGLLQPTLACPDYLSDSEGSWNSSSVFSTSQPETQQNTEVDGGVAESNSAGWNCTKSPLKVNECGAGRAQVTQVDCPAGNILGTKGVHLKNAEDVPEDRSDSITNTLQPETLCAECPGASITPKKCDPLHVTVKEPHTSDRAVTEGGGNVPARAEKERWFVTVDYSPARPQARVPTVKKKRRQKKTCKISHSCRHRQEEPLEVRDTENFIKSNQDGRQSSETNPERVSDLLQMSCEEDNASENFSEATMGKNTPQPVRLTSTLHDTLISKAPTRVESAESDEFSSVHSYDSESYLSAAESAEETRHLLAEKPQPVDSTQLPSPVSLLSESAEADGTQHRQTHSFHSTLSCDVAAVTCDRYECTVDPHSAQTVPPAGHRASKMPDDNSTCDINTHSTEPPVHTFNPTSSGISSGDQLSPVPDLILTPCSVADSPEMYAEATGHTRPVFAISAFWDEMEKLTINDILQLRMSRSSDEAVAQNADEIRHSSPVELSDTADSDYFTQPDESKPERSSCEFSTSDFEEEYWQFVGASRNSSPDPRGKSQEITCDCPFLSYKEEEESTSSEGKEAPVPLEDFACFESQESHHLSKLAWPRQMTKSKSMHNVQALNKEDQTGAFGNDESSLLLSRCQPMNETMLLKDNISLETSASAFLLSNYDTNVVEKHFPEVVEYFLTEYETNNESGYITVYNPEEFSAAPGFDYSLCPLKDDSLCSEDKLIPIFSCCPPTVREITFPKTDYVFLRTEEEVDNFSPIRFTSCSFIEANRCGTHATVAGGSHRWKPLKIGFHDKRIIWGRMPGTWMFPPDAEKGKIFPQVFGELAVQPSILETKETATPEGIFSTLKQSDMCLVCIAFASWVLRSSDPENSDTWKAALLANVSALSAIQYLRNFVKRRRRQHDP